MQFLYLLNSIFLKFFKIYITKRDEIIIENIPVIVIGPYLKGYQGAHFNWDGISSIINEKKIKKCKNNLIENFIINFKLLFIINNLYMKVFVVIMNKHYFN